MNALVITNCMFLIPTCNDFQLFFLSSFQSSLLYGFMSSMSFNHIVFGLPFAFLPHIFHLVFQGTKYVSVIPSVLAVLCFIFVMSFLFQI